MMERVLFPAEAEAHVSSLVNIRIIDIGCSQLLVNIISSCSSALLIFVSSRWQRQREHLHKLNMQVRNQSARMRPAISIDLVSRPSIMLHSKVTSLWRSFWFHTRRYTIINSRGYFMWCQFNVVIEELIAVRLWKDKVFSLLMEDGVKIEKPKTTFPCYIVVCYHLVL